LTALSIAKKIGIVQGDDARVVSGLELAGMDDDQLKEVLKGEVVFARVAPEQKYRVVNALQELGEVVAVTGDGVNDAPALTVQQCFRRTDKIMIQSRRNFTQTFGFRIQYIARPVEIKCVFRHQSHLSCLNLGLFCPN